MPRKSQAAAEKAEELFVDTKTRDLPFAVDAPSGEPQTNLALLPPPQRAALVLKSDKTEQELRELVVKTSAITTVVDANGRLEAHNAAMKLKNARVAIKNTGKAAREDATAFSNAVIAEEKRLVAIIESEEDRIFKLRDDFDAEQARIKAEEERKERERVEGIKAKIASISDQDQNAHLLTADELRARCAALAAVTITPEEYAEFAGAAQQALDATGQKLAELYRAAKAREDQAARLAAEAEAQRIEAERLAAEQARLQAEREAQQKATEAVKRITELSKLEGTAAELGAALEEVRAVPDFAEPMGDMVQMAKDMAIAALEQLHAAAVEAEIAAAAVQPEPEPVLAEAAPEPESAPVPRGFEPIDWDAPPPAPAPATLPRPESYSELDAKIDAGQNVIDELADSDIITLVAESFGLTYLEALERIQRIDFEKARAQA